MKTIHKKILPEYFAAVEDGSKPFELRQEDDTVFEVGDILVLNEFDGEHTGRVCSRTVTYITRGPIYGLQAGWVILGLSQDHRTEYARDYIRHDAILREFGSCLGRRITPTPELLAELLSLTIKTGRTR